MLRDVVVSRARSRDFDESEKIGSSLAAPLGVYSIGSLPAVVLGSSPEDHQKKSSGIVAAFYKLPQLASTIWRQPARVLFWNLEAPIRQTC